MPDVYVAAGSNIRPREHLRKALGLMREAWPGLRVSRAYANKAVGFEGDDFVNLVAGFRTEDSLAAVLEKLHAIESDCGRPREAPKWAPRSMDLDVLMYGAVVGEFPGATLPRGDLLRRPYMLGPMAEIAPQVVHPTAGRTLGELWAQFDVAGHAMTPVSLDEGD
ncbi:MAG: 2-amino-4-hydroxy-6-hydroxymethyldihydropteridine diphosphokinase [Proteobacteria bacterium]|nr:2-amino-4-hydroxy-6-hydroxymethyldihydropteridine diphosphokinase [Pseudomonadota bacterium]